MRWFDVKYGKEEDRRMWLKVHLMCGVKTNIVTSVEISDGYANDDGFFKPLVEAAAANGFTLKEVSADKAYLSGENSYDFTAQGDPLHSVQDQLESAERLWPKVNALDSDA
jgi:hypothetical protein